jgi:uncharacterized membrane protein YgcG
MPDRPLLVTSSSALAGILSGGIIIASLVLGVIGALVLRYMLNIRPLWLAAVLGIGLAGGGLSYLSYKGAQGSEVRFFEEGFEAEANTGEGADFSAFSDTKRRYDEIDLVLRDDELGDRLFGTGSFKLVITGIGTVRLPYLEQPVEVHRLLNERVPQPDELRRRAERGDLDRDSYLWAYWDDDHHVPETPVVDADAFDEMASFDVHDATPGAVQELGEVSEAAGFDSDAVSGIEGVSGVDAGTFDGGGGGADGGGFGGGDGGGGGGGGE